MKQLIQTYHSKFTLAIILGLLVISGTKANPFPVEIKKDLIICQATIDGKTVNLILDTGAPGLVLNSNYYQANQDRNHLCYGVNGSFTCQTRSIENLDWLGIHFETTDALLTDLSILEKTLHCRIDGLAGLSLLKDYYVTLDMDTKLIHITPEAVPGGHFKKFKYSNHVPIIRCQVNGKTRNLGLDTGSENNYLFASGKECPLATPNGNPIQVAGTENEIHDRRFVLMNFELKKAAGNFYFPFIVDQNREQGDLLQLDGLLGQSFLSQFNITIHPGKQLIRFTPRENGVEALANVREAVVDSNQP